MSQYTSIADASAKLILKNLVRRVCLPAGLIAELDAFGLHGLDRDVIYWVVYRSLTTKKGKQPVAVKVLDKALSSHSRRKIKEFLHTTRYIIESRGRYQAGERAICYELNPSTVTIERQHNIEMGPESGIVDDGCLSVIVDCNCVWRSVDLGSLLARVQFAWQSLGYDQSKYDAEWSLRQVDQPELRPEDVTADELIKRGIKPKKSTKKRSANYDAMAEAHRATLSRFWNDRMSGIFRRDGRQYSIATYLARWTRKEVIRFNGKAESVDVSACYIWILAARHRRSLVRSGHCTRQVDGLLDIIESGEFYKRIAELAGVSATDAKASFQVLCIFGKIGCNPLWFALKSLCPGVCSDIQWWRNQPCGSSRLSDMLTRAEGALIDPLVRHMVSNNTGAVRIHDGVELPSGTASIAAEWLSRHSKSLYGRACRLSVTVNGVKSYV